MTTAATMTSYDLLVRFQPIIAIGSSSPLVWTAITHGTCGRSFTSMAGALPPEERQSLEELRIKRTIEAALDAGLVDSDALIALPIGAAIADPDQLLCYLIRTALTHGLSNERLVVEINADERGDLDRAAALARACMMRTVSASLDNFVAGPLSLRLLAQFTPRFVKLAPSLITGIDTSASRRLIAEGVRRLARNMGVTVVGRGARSIGEHDTLDRIGVRYVQFEAMTAPISPRTLRHQQRLALSPDHRRLAHHMRSAAQGPVPMTAQAAATL